ncbi:uncharacterized protein LOC129872293 [Solanum dulcamara]|uniref:uncharacterized protein LOC129872293 n=1 Tax=Solanum dulcamara TaxID=45834 RepID=UPI0024868C9E|nr:uncharacterized protein LOC129872293 [Solanum dulcamara]
MTSIRVVLGLSASLDLEVEQMDVKTIFLHGDLDEEIYMEQPEGFKVKGKENYVCKLKKSLIQELMQELNKSFSMKDLGPESLSLCFGKGKPILYGYTNSNMASEFDSQTELVAAVEACKELL